MKKEKFDKLIIELGKCKDCLHYDCAEKSLINIYKEYDFCTNIPSIWTDWFNRLNSNIMVIGQDWGPYVDMKKLYEQLKNNKCNWKELINSEKSNTKKMLEYYIKESSNHVYSIDDLFITNAIMCARQGNNINLKKSTINCSKYLLKQIEIIEPKVILTLGYYPLLALSKVLGFEIKDTLKNTINFCHEIHINNYIIIPLYHPVAQIKKEEQLKQYKRIWNYI